MRIREELRQRGISAEQARQACSEADADWYQLARHALHKRFGPDRAASVPERARQQRFLSARGFDHDQCRRALGGDED